jgi:hypothetical protein
VLDVLLEADVELELEDELLEETTPLLDEELLLLDELEVPPFKLIVPVVGVKVTRSRRAPSSRLTMRSVWLPAARALKVAGVIVP